MTVDLIMASMKALEHLTYLNRFGYLDQDTQITLIDLHDALTQLNVDVSSFTKHVDFLTLELDQKMSSTT